MSIVQYPENEHVHSRRKVQPTKKMSIDIEDAYGVIRRITPYASSMSIVLIPRMRLRLRRPCYSMALFTLRCIASCMQDAMHRSVNGVLDAKGNYSATSNNTVVGTRAAAPPSPLLAVSTVTAHLSMASVAITVLLYHGPLLCGDDRRVQSSAEILPLKGWGSWGVGVAHSFNRPRMAHLLIIINYNRRQLPN